MTPPDPLDPFYLDGAFYDLLHAGVAHDFDFYVGQARAAGGPILEIACGTGRVTLPIARHGLDITGLDLSAGMLTRAAAKANEAALNVRWWQADCRDFACDRRFALIFIAFNSMQHLHDRSSLEQFFACVKRHLAPGGRFILDVFNPSIAILARGTERHEVMRFDNPDGNGEILVEDVTHYDAARQVTRVKWFYSRAEAKDYRTDELALRCFFPEELDALLAYNSFRTITKLGSFDRAPFQSSSPKQIIVLGDLSAPVSLR